MPEGAVARLRCDQPCNSNGERVGMVFGMVLGMLPDAYLRVHAEPIGYP